MKSKHTFSFALVFFLTASCISLKPGIRNQREISEPTDIRLLNDVIPTKYDLTLWTNPENKDFSGYVTIDFELLNKRDNILLHGQDIEFLTIAVSGVNTELVASSVPLSKDGLLQINFGQRIEKGAYQLKITYRGNYQEDLTGLYRVKDSDDFYLFTDFEPLSARKMLPCFDEPRWKTPFDVKVISKTGQTVVANGPLKSTFIQGNDEVHIFETTKPIPTYLLALAVGPFDVIEGPIVASNEIRSDPILLRGIATKGKGNKLLFALRETKKLLEKLESYFGVGYPYQKLDLLAVPDFAHGAMENVGAITFKEWYLLLDGKTASVEQKGGFYLVTAHELAHQWFGNLVTMAWWDDVWLNEAFATWLSYKIISEEQPELRTEEYFSGRNHHAMIHDSLMAARKIREPIQSTHDIHNAFDSITYSKGAAVLRMLENYVGQDQFRKAVSSYIKQFKFKTATSQDFLASLAKFSDASLAKSAETFLNQTGVPKVILSYQCEKSGFNVHLSQHRYAPIGTSLERDRHWDIPMCIRYESYGKLKKHCFTMNKQSMAIYIKNERCPEFVMPNAHGDGYYRFAMDKDAIRELSKRNSRLNEREKLALADSMMSQFYDGTLEFGFVADVLRDLIDANSAMLVNYFMKLITEANYRWIEEKNRPSMLAYAQNALHAVFTRSLSETGLADHQRIVRKKIANFFANIVKDKETRLDLSIIGNVYLQETLNQNKTHEEKSLPMDENLIDDAVAIALQYQDDSMLDNVVSRLKHENDSVTRGHLLYGLAQSREGDRANKVRSLVFAQNLRKEEKLRLFDTHLENPNNQPATWQFLKGNFEQLKTSLSNSQMAELPYLATGLCSDDAVKEVNALFLPIISGYDGGPRNLAEVIEQIAICSARKTNLSRLANNFFYGLKEEKVAKE